VLITGKNFRPHRTWAGVVLLATLGCIGWWLVCVGKATRIPGGSTPVGLAYGVAGGAIILFEFLLWPRKKVRSWRIGSAQRWLRAHIWLGLLSVPLIVLHSGFELGGQLSALLMLLFVLVIASGIFGLAMQQWLPRTMYDRVPAETIYSQIDHVSNQFCANAEALVLATCGYESGRRKAGDSSEDSETPAFYTIDTLRAASNVRGKVLETRPVFAAVPDSELLREMFFAQIKPFLASGAKSRSRLTELSYARQLFQTLRAQLPPGALGALTALEDLCNQRRQFDVQARLHFWLHAWLWIHLPLSIVLVLLMFVHVFVALKYW
jgi:hypothetical protein